MSRPMGSPAQLEQRRLRALELLKAGHGALWVSRKIGCARSAVYAWQESFRKDGEQGLKAKPVPGRPIRLNALQRKQLARILLSGATKSGYPSEMWTARRVAEVTEKRFGVDYHPNHMWRFLRSLGWSCQKPIKRARERDEAAIEHWKRYEWPSIKKSQKVWRPSRIH
ncbi:MAG: transposase [Elusimicrobia bacterium]|nr:transposase [Elusimicrobiota bacterium]